MNNYFEAEKINKKTIYRIKDDAPAWVTDLVKELHYGSMPIDEIYEIVSDCLDSLLGFETYEDSLNAQVSEFNLTYTDDILKQFTKLFYVLNNSFDEVSEFIGPVNSVDPIVYATQVVTAYHNLCLSRCRDVLDHNAIFAESGDTHEPREEE